MPFKKHVQTLPQVCLEPSAGHLLMFVTVMHFEYNIINKTGASYLFCHLFVWISHRKDEMKIFTDLLPATWFLYDIQFSLCYTILMQPTNVKKFLYLLQYKKFLCCSKLFILNTFSSIYHI